MDKKYFEFKKGEYWKNSLKPIIDRFDKSSPIEQYKIIEYVYNLLKEVQKLSYRINLFDRQYPFEKMDKNDYKKLLVVYLDFLAEVRKLDDKIAYDLFFL
jgi:hypothetical protein